MAMTIEAVLARLESLGDDKVRAHNLKYGAGPNQFGVRLGDVRRLAATIKSDHALGLALWAHGHLEARLLAVLVVKPARLSREELDRMVRSADAPQLADWLNAYVVKKHPEREALRSAWMADDDPWAARAGWSLTSGLIAKNPDGLDVPALLDRIEAEMGSAAPAAQWTMNACLVAIGIHVAKHRTRAIAIGEALGVYRDHPVSTGCTSPFAPIWIQEMVRRQG